MMCNKMCKHIIAWLVPVIIFRVLNMLGLPHLILCSYLIVQIPMKDVQAIFQLRLDRSLQQQCPVTRADDSSQNCRLMLSNTPIRYLSHALFLFHWAVNRIPSLIVVHVHFWLTFKRTISSAICKVNSLWTFVCLSVGTESFYLQIELTLRVLRVSVRKSGLYRARESRSWANDWVLLPVWDSAVLLYKSQGSTRDLCLHHKSSPQWSVR